MTNNVTYYIAVTAVNTAGGKRREITDVTAAPVPDEQGPEFTAIQVDGVDVTDGQTLSAPVKFTANASDAAGVSRVEFRIDETLIRTDYSGNPNYYCYWDIVPVADGSHTLDISAYDTLGNQTDRHYTLTVALAPPAPPVISQPTDGVLTNRATVTVAGAAALSSEVLLFTTGSRASSRSIICASICSCIMFSSLGFHKK